MQSQLLRFGVSRLLGACSSNASIAETVVAAGQRMSVSSSAWLASAPAAAEAAKPAPPPPPSGNASANVRSAPSDLDSRGSRISDSVPSAPPRSVPVPDLLGCSLLPPRLHRCWRSLRIHPVQQRPPAAGSSAHWTGGLHGQGLWRVTP